MWLGSQGDDTQGDGFLFSKSLWQRTMVGESQFYAMEMFYLPKTIKELMRFSAHAFITNDCLNPAIEKLAEYPITEFVFTPQIRLKPEDQGYRQEFKSKDSIVKTWRDLFDIQLQAKGFAIRLSLNFYIYGNAFVSVYQPFDRILVCGNKQCREHVMVTKASYDWDRSKLEFRLKCRKCGFKGAAKVIDKPVRDPKRINLISYYPGNIDIDFDPYSGEKEYYYNIPESEADKIKQGNKLKLEKTPWEIIEAVRIGRYNKQVGPKIKLNKHNIFHLTRHTVDMPGAESPWGMPITGSVLRSIFYLNMMRRAQTALMMDHIIPFRWLFPAADGSPQTTMPMDLGDWRRRMRTEVRKWKNDPLYIMLAPVPVGQGQMGGDAKALMLFPEMEQIRVDIMNGLNVPQEFVRGGLQYTGTSVSLRMLENSLLNQVEQVEKCFRWIGRRVSQITGLELVEISLKRFKMADDIQQRQLAFQMWAAQAISGQLLGQIMDFDYMHEVRQRNAENIETALGAAKAQAEAGARLMSLQMLLQNILPPEAKVTPNQMDPAAIDQIFQGIKGMKPMDQGYAVQQIAGQNPEVGRMLQERAMADPSTYASQFQALLAMAPQTQVSELEKLKQSNPLMAGIMAELYRTFGLEELVTSNPMQGGGGGSGGGGGVQPAMLPSVQMQVAPPGPALPPGMGAAPGLPGVEKPMPEQRPPRRQGGSPM